MKSVLGLMKMWAYLQGPIRGGGGGGGKEKYGMREILDDLVNMRNMVCVKF